MNARKINILQLLTACTIKKGGLSIVHQNTIHISDLRLNVLKQFSHYKKLVPCLSIMFFSSHSKLLEEPAIFQNYVAGVFFLEDI